MKYPEISRKTSGKKRVLTGRPALPAQQVFDAESLSQLIEWQ
jgi:hypothetical protein